MYSSAGNVAVVSANAVVAVVAAVITANVVTAARITNNVFVTSCCADV